MVTPILCPNHLKKPLKNNAVQAQNSSFLLKNKLASCQFQKTPPPAIPEINETDNQIIIEKQRESLETLPNTIYCLSTVREIYKVIDKDEKGVIIEFSFQKLSDYISKYTLSIHESSAIILPVYYTSEDPSLFCVDCCDICNKIMPNEQEFLKSTTILEYLKNTKIWECLSTKKIDLSHHKEVRIVFTWPDRILHPDNAVQVQKTTQPELLESEKDKSVDSYFEKDKSGDSYMDIEGLPLMVINKVYYFSDNSEIINKWISNHADPEKYKHKFEMLQTP
ncbi:MAG: hypothetical protein HRT90_02470 [Candidatus Margulisbacteria bacterium]|nr:hypothetical protein [Candidatus Margulisiibacteriota bacterium]